MSTQLDYMKMFGVLMAITALNCIANGRQIRTNRYTTEISENNIQHENDEDMREVIVEREIVLISTNTQARDEQNNPNPNILNSTATVLPRRNIEETYPLVGFERRTPLPLSTIKLSDICNKIKPS